ncbi:putative dephospho-CoA kinase [Prochlorococcus marinus str. MIT 9313]|uniref:Dephospho-CoA kinase n=1 Tax=Prochlorococcus marinus (strain MIT 9313) TaxID=74547 RepID=COAE_PROMM|nr:RecName: Full=Dephospho-CoA kinase; AltName: Full=Dephosphocoenzyme A kinase [Prochlorococcus marinus str. MIT 9313]CAE22310.1 putative dephospho-CoA kinase [Prochlorococcus marinus str. MIT 9313]
MPQARWHGPQRRIGVTGGIASGKSSVGLYLSEQHALPLLDADIYARDALVAGSAATMAVLQRYGNAVAEAGQLNPISIDRIALASIIFSDAQERRWLEQLIHPIVAKRFDVALADLSAEPVVVLMIPLLFEAKLSGLCSDVWLVDCSPAQQCQRLIARDGLTLKQAEQRISTQWPLEQKRPLADLVIDNSGAPRAWRDQISSIC